MPERQTLVGDAERQHPTVFQRVLAIPLEMRKAATVLTIAVLMASSFVAAYTIALGRPSPRHLPVGVVGTPPAQLLGELQARSNEFDLRTYPSRESAVDAVNRQQITAIIDASGPVPELLVSSASDPSSARAL